MNATRNQSSDGSDDLWYQLEPEHIKQARRAEEAKQREVRERAQRAKADAERARRERTEEETRRRGKERDREDSTDKARRDNPDAYYGRILGLSGRITRADIRKCYLKVIAKYHPDRVHDLGDELIEVAERKTKEINEAYSFFCRKYDM